MPQLVGWDLREEKDQRWWKKKGQSKGTWETYRYKHKAWLWVLRIKYSLCIACWYQWHHPIYKKPKQTSRHNDLATWLQIASDISYSNSSILGFEQTSHYGKNRTYAWAQQHELLLTKADLATSAAQCQTDHWQRQKQSPW